MHSLYAWDAQFKHTLAACLPLAPSQHPEAHPLFTAGGRSKGATKTVAWPMAGQTDRADWQFLSSAFLCNQAMLIGGALPCRACQLWPRNALLRLWHSLFLYLLAQCIQKYTLKAYWMNARLFFWKPLHQCAKYTEWSPKSLPFSPCEFLRHFYTFCAVTYTCVEHLLV